MMFIRDHEGNYNTFRPITSRDICGGVCKDVESDGVIHGSVSGFGQGKCGIECGTVDEEQEGSGVDTEIQGDFGEGVWDKCGEVDRGVKKGCFHEYTGHSEVGVTFGIVEGQ